eukprot:365348-Chlamydomonas_euryale.AAC.3
MPDVVHLLRAPRHRVGVVSRSTAAVSRTASRTASHEAPLRLVAQLISQLVAQLVKQLVEHLVAQLAAHLATQPASKLVTQLVAQKLKEKWQTFSLVPPSVTPSISCSVRPSVHHPSIHRSIYPCTIPPFLLHFNGSCVLTPSPSLDWNGGLIPKSISLFTGMENILQAVASPVNGQCTPSRSLPLPWNGKYTPSRRLPPSMDDVLQAVAFSFHGMESTLQAVASPFHGMESTLQAVGFPLPWNGKYTPSPVASPFHGMESTLQAPASPFNGIECLLPNIRSWLASQMHRTVHHTQPVSPSTLPQCMYPHSPHSSQSVPVQCLQHVPEKVQVLVVRRALRKALVERAAQLPRGFLERLPLVRVQKPTQADNTKWRLIGHTWRGRGGQWLLLPWGI